MLVESAPIDNISTNTRFDASARYRGWYGISIPWIVFDRLLTRQVVWGNLVVIIRNEAG